MPNKSRACVKSADMKFGDDHERGGGLPVAGHKLKRVRPVEVGGGRKDQIRRGAGERAVGGSGQQGEAQGVAFHIRCRQHQVGGGVFRGDDDLRVGHRRIVHRLDDQRDGGRRRIQPPVAGDELK